MKKTKLISIVLAAIMVLSMIPFAMIPVSAAGTTHTQGSIDDMPKILPGDKTLTGSKLWVDWSNSGGFANGGTSVDTNGYVKVNNATDANWTNNGMNTTAWRGAEGIMFYVDAENITANHMRFYFDFLLSGTRPNNGGNGCVWVRSVPTYHDNDDDGNGVHTIKVGAKSVAYYFDGSNWNSTVTGLKAKALTPVDGANTYTQYFNAYQKTSGWFYIPFSSFYSFGGSGVHSSSDTGLNFNEFMETFENQEIWKIAIKSETPGLLIDDIHFVYSASEYVDGATYTTNTQEITIKNGASVTYTLPDTPNAVMTQMTNATGIRFHVDTTALGENAKLNLCVRPFQGNQTKVSFYQSGSDGTTDLSFAWECYVARQGNSVAYYFGDNGVAKPLYLKSVDTSTTTGNADDDIFKALPNGYVGDIYIPLDSYWLCVESWHGVNKAPSKEQKEQGITNIDGEGDGDTGFSAMLSWAEAMKIGGNLIPYKFGLRTVIEGTVDSGAAGTVTYSNFRLVFDDVQLTSETVNVADDLAMKVTATVKDDATITGATATLGGDATPARVENNVVICDGILPQNVAKTLNITVTSKTKDNVVITNTYSTSVKDYCLALIDGNYGDEAKAVAADLLRYAAAADTYVTGSSEILNGVEIEGLGNKTAAPTTNNSAVSNSTKDGYSIDSVALVLEGALKVKINVTVPAEGDAVTIAYRVAGDTETSTANVEGGAALIAIGAADLNKEIQVKLVVGNEPVQYLKYSMSDYFADYLNDETVAEKDLALVTAVYNYCASAAAYAKSLATN